MIIALEGLDGVGKTTVSRILAERLPARYVRLPPPELQLVSASLFTRHSSLARYLYYLSGVATIAELGQPAGLVVADRYITSAHALHAHTVGAAAEALRRLPMPAPDLTLLLEADEGIRRSRLSLRGTGLDPFERALNDDDAFRASVLDRLRTGPDTHVIDTTNLLVDEVVERAMEIFIGTVRGGPDASDKR